MNYLFDTCLVSELIKSTPNPTVVNWVRQLPAGTDYISTFTLGELYKGVAKMPESRRRNEINVWIDTFILAHFAGRIVPFDMQMAQLWGEMVGQLVAQGKRPSLIDSLIAAQALQRDFTLVTRNVADFAHTGATLFNPWANTKK